MHTYDNPFISIIENGNKHIGIVLLEKREQEQQEITLDENNITISLWASLCLVCEKRVILVWFGLVYFMWSVSMLLPATLLLLLGAVGLNRQVIQDNPHILNVHIKRPVLLNSETEAEAVFAVSG